MFLENFSFAHQVPNLFEPEEYEQVLNGTRPHAKDAGIPEGDRLAGLKYHCRDRKIIPWVPSNIISYRFARDAVYNHFISRVRSNLHIVLCMSPVGDAFRTRCRMFPSLVNCCTIDWFTEWPRFVYLNKLLELITTLL